MNKPRRYRLLCPIARALDRIGDRWTLLILRDLHAGPARFSDLQSGLGGIASNLLAGRLQQLLEDGLARRRDAGFGVTVYELTETGAKSADLLFEPDHPRAVAATGMACGRGDEDLGLPGHVSLR